MTDPTPEPRARSTAGRAWRMAGLVMLSVAMAVPLMLIAEIAAERRGYSDEAAWTIAQSWGGRQTLSGPFLVVPVEGRREVEIRNDDGSVSLREETGLVEPAILMPERLEIDSTATTEIRARGIFEVPVYTVRHALGLDFDPARLAGSLGEGERLLWDRAELVIGVSEPRALRGVDTGGTAPAFEPGSGLRGLKGIHAPLGDPRGLGDLAITLTLGGSQGLHFTPTGRQTTVRLGADWPHPSFVGHFLPAAREIGPEGFTASWEIPHLARPVEQVLRGPAALGRLQAAAFGFGLFQPVDLYHKAERAAKYGILFIALTFCTVFLMEGAARRPTHVAQYVLIGAAQCVFFLLLLSLAEQIGFGAAYLAAAAATIALLSFYAVSALGLGRRGLILTGALGVLYAVMYLILISEDYALLAGSVLAFAAVAATMVATRHDDWGSALRLPKLRPPGPASG